MLRTLKLLSLVQTSPLCWYLISLTPKCWYTRGLVIEMLSCSTCPDFLVFSLSLKALNITCTLAPPKLHLQIRPFLLTLDLFSL